MSFSYETVATKLKETGRRMTAQRTAVIHVLHNNKSHPTVEKVARCVQKDLPSTSLSTIYAILDDFIDLELLRKIDDGERMRVDPDTSSHAHLMCKKCGIVTDVTMRVEDIKKLEKTVLDTGGTIEKIDVNFHGICPNCSTS